MCSTHVAGWPSSISSRMMLVYGCLLALVSMLVEGQDTCQVAQRKCVSRIGCGMALSNFFIDCGSLIHGETTECSKRCKKALISLLSTDDREGEDFINCDCGGNEFCEVQKQRTNACAKDVVPAMKAVNDDKTAISCSLAEMICRADTPCLTALEFYEDHCSKLIRGEKCTPRCNNSISILYRVQKARKLRNCVCDGTEDLPIPCEDLQQNTERLCFGRTGPPPSSSAFSLDDDETVTHHHRHGVNSTRSEHRDSHRTNRVDASLASASLPAAPWLYLMLLLLLLHSHHHYRYC